MCIRDRHYIDRAYSAKTDNRPEFQNMIKDSGKRLFDIVIVWKLDRFARKNECKITHNIGANQIKEELKMKNFYAYCMHLTNRGVLCEFSPVSYTHLDVYKRQQVNR